MEAAVIAAEAEEVVEAVLAAEAEVAVMAEGAMAG